MNRLKKTIFARALFAVLGIVAAVGLGSLVNIYHVTPLFDRAGGKWHFHYGGFRYYGDIHVATFFEDGKFINIVHLGCG